MKATGFNAFKVSFNRQSKSLLSPIGVAVFLALTLLTGSTSLHAGKPAPKLPKLDSVLCSGLGGTWTLNTCTIAEGAWGQATASFVIPSYVSLVIQGDGTPPESPTEPYLPCTFVLGFGVTLQNDGFIHVQTTGDLGFCNLGTLKNAGSLEVANVSLDGTANTGMANLAMIANSGTITVNNVGGYYSIGILNLPHIPAEFSPYTFDTILPTLTNSGTVIIENSGERSTGILNAGAISNAGNITISADIFGNYGLDNGGTFTNEVSGTLVNFFGDPTLLPPTMNAPTYGVVNFDGTMLNYGSVTNKGVIGTDGWAMLTFGTLDNYGVLYQSGGVLVNYGTVHNWGQILTDGSPDYPHNEGICENLPSEDGTAGSGC